MDGITVARLNYLKPDWLRKPVNLDLLRYMKQTLRRWNLHSVCEEARCPNIGECFRAGEVTFLLLGDVCTRHCRFCNVGKGKPGRLDPEEPERIKKCVAELGLHYVVLTSVSRDDLADGGAEIFSRCVSLIRQIDKTIKVELLIPDFLFNRQALEKVALSGAEVIGHNIETVPSLYKRLRPEAVYRRSLEVLAYFKKINPHLYTKSGLMLGLGETKEEVIKVLEDLRGVGCDFLSLGQYLAPSFRHVPVQQYVHPQEFDKWREIAETMGFKAVKSSPWVRSSYQAASYLT